jgi:hypothetical protein
MMLAMTEVFFPCVELLDGCSCHSSDELLDMCHHVGILPILLPRTLLIWLSPWRGLFAIHKSAIQRVRPPTGMGTRSRRLVAPRNAISAFKQTGLHPIRDRERRSLGISVGAGLSRQSMKLSANRLKLSLSADN